MDAKMTGDYLAALRKARGLTQQEVGEKLGISNKTVSKWESGGGFPDITVLPALAELYGVTADEILAGETREQAQPSGPSEVGRYLARRGELRFRLGWAASAMCLLAGMAFHTYWLYLPLLLAGAALALWVGWGPCGREQVTGRCRMTLPLAAVELYLLIWRFAPWTILNARVQKWGTEGFYGVSSYLRRHITWSLWLLLLPALYAGLRWVEWRFGEGKRLLSRPVFRTLAAGWLVSLCLDVVGWAAEWPLTRVEPKWYWDQDWLREAWQPFYAACQSREKAARIVLLLTLGAAALVWLWEQAKGKRKQ